MATFVVLVDIHLLCLTLVSVSFFSTSSFFFTSLVFTLVSMAIKFVDVDPVWVFVDVIL